MANKLATRMNRMTAEEVLERYAGGTRDFRRLNLSGQFFPGKDLSDADFSECRIRGTNFTNATLKNVKFTEAQAGLEPIWERTLTVALWIAFFWSGMTFVFINALEVFKLHGSNLQAIITSIACSSVIAVFVLIAISRGTIAAFISLLLAIPLLFGAAVLVNRVRPGFLDIALVNAVTPTMAFVLAVGNYLVVSITFAALAFKRYMAVTGAVVLVLVAAAIGIEKAVLVPSFCAAILTLFMLYLSWRSLQGEPKDAWMRKLAVNLLALRGTNFIGADLTDADFTEALLQSTDLRKAKLVRTCWRDAKNLDRSRLEGTYLEREELRRLVVTCEGQNQKFEGQNLRDLNLSGANLIGASFMDADLYNSNLTDANLSRTLLVRTQLERANLKGVCLTGACIQDWSVTRTTNLAAVECKYIFLKYIDGDKRDQIPPKGEFAPGEFILFVRSILDTLDLYHDREVHPGAALTVLRSLSEEEREPLEIVGLEKRGAGMVIKIKISPWSDEQKLKAEYYSRYTRILNLSISDPQQIFSGNEALERRIGELVAEIKQRPTHTNINYLYNEGLFISGGKTNINLET